MPHFPSATILFSLRGPSFSVSVSLSFSVPYILRLQIILSRVYKPSGPSLLPPLSLFSFLRVPPHPHPACPVSIPASPYCFFFLASCSFSCPPVSRLRFRPASQTNPGPQLPDPASTAPALLSSPRRQPSSGPSPSPPAQTQCQFLSSHSHQRGLRGSPCLDTP